MTRRTSIHLRAPLFAAALASLLAASPPAALAQVATPAPVSLQPLLNFKNTDVKFSLTALMGLLRDRDHEGWVLAAYPDPNTSRPLIGAGFSLDVPATDHPQYDPLNASGFLEPSSAQLWQAAGLSPTRLEQILDDFNANLQAWGTKGYRRRTQRHSLPPQLSEEEATRLLRISATQAAYNARAYCRNFDRLSGPAQLALTQLVFQMGINLEQFVEFLSELNGDTLHRDLSLPDGGVVTELQHWRDVQNTLIDSQWARRYTTRAATVIAMFDPDYGGSPRAAEARILAILRPPKARPTKRAARHRGEHQKTRR